MKIDVTKIIMGIIIVLLISFMAFGITKCVDYDEIREENNNLKKYNQEARDRIAVLIRSNNESNQTIAELRKIHDEDRTRIGRITEALRKEREINNQTIRTAGEIGEGITRIISYNTEAGRIINECLEIIEQEGQ